MIATTVRCLTPPGTGAIAVVEVKGRDAWPIVRGHLRARSQAKVPETLPETGTVIVAKFGPPPGDDVVVVISSNSPPTVEVQCHGGPLVVAWLVDSFVAAGGTHFVAGPDELLRMLTCAPTVRTASILLDQYRGAMCRACDAIVDLVRTGQSDHAAARIARLLDLSDLGEHLVEPWQVVVAGAPNVGKSSLVNAIAGYQRCVVTPIPGTTRDVVSVRLVIDGWPVLLSDTAGIRDNAGEIESAGIERAIAAAGRADLCLWLVDATAEPIWPEVSRPNVIHVLNKVDQPSAWQATRSEELTPVSAVTGQGIDSLLDRISSRLVAVTPLPGEAVPTTTRQTALLREAALCLSRHEPDRAMAALATITSGAGLPD